jgi:peptidoglycan/LPS O-acetylase OafA/YrhL
LLDDQECFSLAVESLVSPKVTMRDMTKPAHFTLAPLATARRFFATDNRQERLMTLADLLRARQNSFGPLRLVLALMVVWSHGFYLTSGQRGIEPVYALTGQTLGQHAVEAFFVISGILISASLARSRTLLSFILARVARILPALLACVVLTTFVIGPLFSSLPLSDYVTVSTPYLYVLETVALTTGSAPLPHVFDGLPVANAINIPLYTLKYEVICYALLGLTALVGVAAHRWFMSSAATAVLGLNIAMQFLHVTGSEGAESLLPRFLLCFMIGVTAWQWRDRLTITIAPVLLLVGVYILSLGSTAQWLLGPFAMAAIVLWVAGRQWQRLQRFTADHDMSYGIYIWGWVIQQCVISLIPGIAFLPHLLTTLMILIPLAWLSWTVVEAPSLAWAKGLGQPDDQPVAPTRLRAEGQLAATLAQRV